MIFSNKKLLLAPLVYFHGDVKDIGKTVSDQSLLIDVYDSHKISIGIESNIRISQVSTETISEILSLYNDNMKNNISDITYKGHSIFKENTDGYRSYKYIRWYFDIEEELALYWRFKLEGMGAITL